ncbi:HEPN domain-containing protein [Candidatus Micrarchaeota archaeon]|nr:HEPN domain-containing protein [Candidatus Micrarchaeota archaeon]
MRKESENWIAQAKEDFDAAAANLKIKKYYVAAFLSQQCAEKAIKALHIEKTRSIQIKSHNLIELGEALKVPERIMGCLMELNFDYTIARYPDAANTIPAKAYNEIISERKIEYAKEVLEWVLKQIKK